MKVIDQAALDRTLAKGTLARVEVGAGCRVSGGATPIACTEVVFRDTSFRESELAGARFVDCTFHGCLFRSADLSEAVFEGCRFYDADVERGCDFSYANVRRARFERTDLTTAVLTRVRAFGIEVLESQATGADFSDADFSLGHGEFAQATFDRCNLAYADFSRTTLDGCAMTGCRLHHALLHDASLQGADLQGSGLENIEGRGLVLAGADLRGATFNNLDPRAIDLSGVRIDPEQGLELLRAMGIVV
jgi:fluoroquinolone resistance protein